MHKVGSKIDRLTLLCFIIRIWVNDTYGSANYFVYFKTLLITKSKHSLLS